MIRVMVLKIAPILIPASAAGVRVFEGKDSGVGGADDALDESEAGVDDDIVDEFVEEGGDGVDGTEVVDGKATIVEPADPPSKLRYERPHVSGATSSLDVMAKAPSGVFAKSSSARFSSCM